MDYSRVIDRLITRQLRDWDLAGANYEALAGVATRSLSLGEATVTLQFNPERRRSSAAVIDRRSLARRKCFLCTEYQPAKQKAMLWGERYKIQVNPYPIFKRHLTIADLHHVPQRLADRISDMLMLAQSLPDFVVFYNGPRCGASAPDHMHFQAGAKGEMPLCDEMAHATTHLLADSDEGFIGYVDQLGRNLFTIETSSDELEKLLLSPASVDMGGLWAVPERKDFDALTPRMVQALYDELCMSRKELTPVFNGFAHYWENHQPI